MSRVAFPFLTLPETVVRFGAWMIGQPGEPLSPATDTLENWDYERDIEVNIHIHVDFQEAANILQIDAARLRLAVVLVAGTGSGSMARRLDRLSTAELSMSHPATTIETVIHGRMLSGQLQLSLRIVLQSPTQAGGPLSPKHRGSRLWEQHKRILIEDGGDSRFPIELASFSDIFKDRPERYSPWLVDWNPTVLEGDFGGNLRLYVNSDNAAVRSRFVEGDSLTLQAMVADVMTQIIEVTLENERELHVNPYEEGSIGFQARAWMEIAFVGLSLDAIRQMRIFAPGKFKALILATADFGDSE